MLISIRRIIKVLTALFLYFYVTQIAFIFPQIYCLTNLNTLNYGFKNYQL